MFRFEELKAMAESVGASMKYGKFITEKKLASNQEYGDFLSLVEFHGNGSDVLRGKFLFRKAYLAWRENYRAGK